MIRHIFSSFFAPTIWLSCWAITSFRPELLVDTNQFMIGSLANVRMDQIAIPAAIIAVALFF